MEIIDIYTIKREDGKKERYSQPIAYPVEDGFRLISNDFIEKEDRYINRDNLIETTIKKNVQEEFNLIYNHIGGHEIKLDLRATVDIDEKGNYKEIQKVQNNKSYKYKSLKEKMEVVQSNVFTNVVDEFEIKNDKSKHNIVIQNKIDTQNNLGFKFIVETENETFITPQEDIKAHIDEGFFAKQLFFVGKNDKNIGLDNLWAKDAEGLTTDDLKYYVKAIDYNRYELIITIKKEFLKNAVYPIKIDPTTYSNYVTWTQTGTSSFEPGSDTISISTSDYAEFEVYTETEDGNSKEAQVKITNTTDGTTRYNNNKNYSDNEKIDDWSADSKNYEFYIETTGDDHYTEDGIRLKIVYEEDTEAPDCSANPSSQTSWTNSNIDVEITLTDDMGATKMWLLIDHSSSRSEDYIRSNGDLDQGFNDTNVTGNYTISDEGELYAHVVVEDVAGKRTTKSFGPYNIDKSDPNYNNDADISGYDYYDGNVYWVKYYGGFSVQYSGSPDEGDIDKGRHYLRALADDGDQAKIKGYDDGLVDNEFNTSDNINLNGTGEPELISNSEKKLEIKYNPKIKSEGKEFELQGYLADNAGNTYGYFDLGLTVAGDQYNPDVSVDKESRDWDNTDVDVKINASDEESGLDKLYYKWSEDTSTPDDWNEIEDGDTVTKSDTGEWYLHVKAVDNVGLVREEYFGTYKIDKVDPDFPSVSVSNKDHNSVSLSWSVNDTGGSGVSHVRLYFQKSNSSKDNVANIDIDGDGDTEYSLNIGDKESYTIDGLEEYQYYRYYIRVIDNAGNQRNDGYYLVRTDDNTAPSISVDNEGTNGWVSTNPSVTINASDNDSGLSGLWYAWGQESPSSYTSISNGSTVTLTSNGAYTLFVAAEDNDGNYIEVIYDLYKRDTSSIPTSVDINSRDWQINDINVEVSYSDNTYAGLDSFEYKWLYNSDSDDYTGFNSISNNTTVTQKVSGAWKLQLKTTTNSGVTNYDTYDIYKKDDFNTNVIVDKDSTGTYSNSKIDVTPWGTSAFLQADGNVYGSIRNKYYESTNLDGLTLYAEIQTESDAMCICSFDRSEYYRFGIGSTGESGKLTFNIKDSNGIHDISSNTTVNDGEKHIVAVTYDSGTVKFFIDYSLDKEVNLSASTYGSGVKRYGFMFTGSEADAENGTVGPDSRFKGSISNFQIYEGALPDGYMTDKLIAGTAKEITYNSDPDLVYFMNGNDSILYDKTDNNYHCDVSTGVFDINYPGVTREYAIEDTYRSSWGEVTNPQSFSNDDVISIPDTTNVEGYFLLYTRLSSTNSNIKEYGEYLYDDVSPSISVDNSSRDWGSSNINVDVTVDDGTSTNTYYAWNQDNSTPDSWNDFSPSDQVTQTSNGEWYLHIKAIDEAGNETIESFGTYKKDDENPTVSYSSTNRDWDDSTVSVDLNFSDSISGINSSQYKWSESTSTPSSWNDFTGNPVEISNNGEWYLHAKAVDNAGNTHTTYEGPYKIDNLAPEITFDKESQYWTNSDVEINITFSDDGGSGIDSKEYAITNSSDTPSSWEKFNGNPITITDIGEWYLHAKATDDAGNTTTTTRGTYQIDKEAPSVDWSHTNMDWDNEMIDVSVTSDGGISGTSSILYAWSEETNEPSEYSNIETSSNTIDLKSWFEEEYNQSGEWYAHVEVIDNAGNTITDYVGPFKYDITDPDETNKPYTNSDVSNYEPTWEWEESADEDSGVSGYYIKVGTTSNGDEITPETWVGDNLSHTVETLPDRDDYYLSVKVEDNAGNQSSWVSSDLHSVDPIDTKQNLKISSSIINYDFDRKQIVLNEKLINYSNPIKQNLNRNQLELNRNQKFHISPINNYLIREFDLHRLSNDKIKPFNYSLNRNILELVRKFNHYASPISSQFDYESYYYFNPITISDKLKNISNKFSTQFEYEYSIYNEDKDQELNDYIKFDSFTISHEEKSVMNLSKADKSEFTINLKRYNCDKSRDELIEAEDTIIINTSINNETITLFKGIVKGIEATHSDLKHEYHVTIYDKFKKGIDNKFEEDQLFLDHYISNPNDKEKSLVHQFAYLMDITDEEMEVFEVTNQYGEYIKIPFLHIEKGTKILKELTELTEAVNGKTFINHEGGFMFTSPYLERKFDPYITFDKNIKKHIKHTIEEAENDAVEINFNEFEIDKRQIVWKYTNESSYDEANDKANILIDADQESSWIKFSFIEDIIMDVDTNPETLFEDKNGDEVSINYELNLNTVEQEDSLAATSGKVKFINDNDFPVYIQRFKLYGKPIKKHSNNEIMYYDPEDYTEGSNYTPESKLSIDDNKYIQTTEIAYLTAQYKYYQECRDKDIYNFDSFIVPLVDVGNIVKLDSLDVNKNAIVKSVKHNFSNYSTSLQLENYNFISAKDNTANVLIDRSIDDNDLLQSNYRNLLNYININNNYQILYNFDDDFTSTNGKYPINSHYGELVNGKFNQGALIEDDHQGLLLSESFSENGFKERLINLWFKPNNNFFSNSSDCVIYKEKDDLDGLLLYIGDNRDKMILTVRHNAYNQETISYDIPDNFKQNNQFAMITAKFNHGEIKLYWNGNLVDSLSINDYNTIPSVTDGTACIGNTDSDTLMNISENFGHPINGVVDDFMISLKNVEDEYIKAWYQINQPFKDSNEKIIANNPSNVEVEEV